jgi:hypothetical protein
MKLYGSVINRIEEHVLSPKPEVGMGATIFLWSDRHAATVTKVSPSGKTIELTEDDVTKWEKWPSGYGIEFTANPNGRKYEARLTKNGTWKSAGNGVALGRRAAYRDPSF